MENQIRVRDYKGAVVEYSCESCYAAENFNVNFSEIPKAKSGRCEHLNFNFLLLINKCNIKYLISFTCTNGSCKYQKNIELFNNHINDICGNIEYSCEKCGNGKIFVGFLLTDNLNLLEEKEDNEFLPINPNNIITLKFICNGKEYTLQTDKDFSIPEAFCGLCETNQHLKNLDIQLYKKGNEELSQFMSIKELDLKDNDTIEIQERQYSGWDNE